jgi:hypothetical protein
MFDKSASPKPPAYPAGAAVANPRDRQIEYEKLRHVSKLAYELALRVDDLIPNLLPHARRCGNYWLIGSIDGERGNSLFIRRHGARAGKWSDAATGQFGDLLDLIEAARRLSKADARDEARAWLGYGQAIHPVSALAKTTASDEGATRAALEIWNQAKPIAGTLGEKYFVFRAVNLPIPATIRYCGALLHKPTGLIVPAIVVAVQAPDGRVSAIQRIYIRQNGCGKAGVRQPKMTLAPLGAGAVRLSEATDTLGLAEGVETGLSAMELHGVPVWAALGRRFDAIALHDSVRRVIVFRDNGEPGEDAAERARAKFEGEGRTVEIVAPPAEYGDWNDVAQARGMAGAA